MKSQSRHVIASSDIHVRVPPDQSIRWQKSASETHATTCPFGPGVENKPGWESMTDGFASLLTKSGWHAASNHGLLPRPDSAVVTTWQRGLVTHSGLETLKQACTSLLRSHEPKLSSQPSTSSYRSYTGAASNHIAAHSSTLQHYSILPYVLDADCGLLV